MKKPQVLNRAMFNQGGTSAYGRGITSNLVTEQQRQKFNYGGRVGLRNGSNYGYGTVPIQPITKEDIYGTFKGGNYASRNMPTMDFLQETEEGDLFEGPLPTSEYAYKPKEKTLDEKIEADIQLNPENETVSRSKLDRLQKEMGASDDPAAEVMADSDTMDWDSILKPTAEQKRMTKGEGQLGLAAAALDVFSQPSIAKGMKAASPHLLNLGKTATADKKAIDKAILQGKVLSKVYGDRAKAKGEADIETLKYKAGQTDKPLDVYKATLNLAATKDTKNVNKDPYIASAFFNATTAMGQGINPKILKGAKIKGGIEEDQATIQSAKEGDIFLLNGNFSQIIDGELEDISVEELLKV